MSTKDLTIRNTGTNRVIIGPPPTRNAAGEAIRERGAFIRFDTGADEKVPAAKRLGSAHVVKGDAAESIRGSKVVTAMGERLGLRLS